MNDYMKCEECGEVSLVIRDMDGTEEMYCWGCSKIYKRTFKWIPPHPVEYGEWRMEGYIKVDKSSK